MLPGESGIFSAQLDGDVPDASIELNAEDVAAFAEAVGNAGAINVMTNYT